MYTSCWHLTAHARSYQMTIVRTLAAHIDNNSRMSAPPCVSCSGAHPWRMRIIIA